MIKVLGGALLVVVSCVPQLTTLTPPPALAFPPQLSAPYACGGDAINLSYAYCGDRAVAQISQNAMVFARIPLPDVDECTSGLSGTFGCPSGTSLVTGCATLTAPRTSGTVSVSITATTAGGDSAPAPASYVVLDPGLPPVFFPLGWASNTVGSSTNVEVDSVTNDGYCQVVVDYPMTDGLLESSIPLEHAESAAVFPNKLLNGTWVVEPAPGAACLPRGSANVYLSLFCR